MEGGFCQRIRNSTRLVILIVFLSLFVDSMLLTLVDPILPDILANLENTTTADTTAAINNNGRYGYLVAAKGLAQFLCNPFVGLLVTRMGYRRPMLVGDIILLVSTVAFAYGWNYTFLFVTRLFQGASSSVTAVTGMGLLASTFTNDEERGKVMGIAIGGISLGIIAGPIYGSIIYQFFGQAMPFLILAAIVGLTVVLQLITLKADDSAGKDHSMMSMIQLVKDPYILLVAGNIFLLNLDVSMVLAFLPIRLIDLENPETWKLGIVVLPTSIGYLIAGLIFPRTTRWIKRWIAGLIGLVAAAGTLIGLAFCRTFESMLLVTTFLGVALGMVSTAMQPIFALLVDLRHTAAYGNVYAISDMAVCLAMFVGPLVGGPILYQLGFEWLVIGVGILNLAFSQFSVLLRDPPARFIKEGNNNLLTAVKGQKDSSEKTPLIYDIEKTGRNDSISSNTLTNTLPTMDLSRVPTPRYIGCLSGVEDFYSDGEPMGRQVRRMAGYESW